MVFVRNWRVASIAGLHVERQRKPLTLVYTPTHGHAAGSPFSLFVSIWYFDPSTAATVFLSYKHLWRALICTVRTQFLFSFFAKWWSASACTSLASLRLTVSPDSGLYCRLIAPKKRRLGWIDSTTQCSKKPPISSSSAELVVATCSVMLLRIVQPKLG